MTLSNLIASLSQAGLAADSEQILDMLWLASLDRGLSTYRVLLTPTIEQPHVTVPPKSTPIRPVKQFARDGLRTPLSRASPPSAADRTEVYPNVLPSSSDRARRASPISIPVGRALPNRLPLMRALRPLRQRWPSQQIEEIDEERTVETTAYIRGGAFKRTRSQIFYPVFRPRREPWYDVDVVLEDDAAIDLWSETLRDFCQMLRETGSFRIVRSWRLRILSGAAPTAVVRLEASGGGDVSVAQLATYGARRLIIFATHGSSMRWRDGSYVQVLSSCPAAALWFCYSSCLRTVGRCHGWGSRTENVSPDSPDVSPHHCTSTATRGISTLKARRRR